MKLFKKKSEVQNLSIGDNLRNFCLLGDEAEILGNRLDHARDRASKATSPWAKQYWSNAVEYLVGQWKKLPILHDGDAKMSIMPRWIVDYNYYERQQEGPLYNGVSDKLYNKL